MTTTAKAIHMVGTRICVASECDEAGILVEFHTQRAQDNTLTQVTLRWRCPACHAWQRELRGRWRLHDYRDRTGQIDLRIVLSQRQRPGIWTW